jgi:hypothetical protein
MTTITQIYQITYDEKLDAVVMKWNGYSTSEQFREGTELMLNTLIQNKCSKVLADIREMILIGSEDQKWLEENFLPRAIKFGFRKIAIVKPKSYFNKVAVETVSFKVDRKHLDISFFDSLEEGQSWISATLQ